jgi:antitoxin VapB
MTVAVIISMRERLQREERKRESKQQLIADLMAIADHCASLPVLDSRSEDEIMGWDENGLPS